MFYAIDWKHPINNIKLVIKNSVKVEMKDILRRQLESIRNIIIAGYNGGNLVREIGVALNSIRDLMMRNAKNDELEFLLICAPIDVTGTGKYAIPPSDALRLCDQLLSFFNPYQIENSEKCIEDEQDSDLDLERLIPCSKKVFIVHGHDEENLLRLRRLLKDRIGLDPVILSERPDKGRTIVEKFEQEANQCGFSFILFTPDDLVASASGQKVQARPNVLFEIGWFYGRLGRDRVCILYKTGTSIPSDLEGIGRISFDHSVEEKISEIERELEAVYSLGEVNQDDKL